MHTFTAPGPPPKVRRTSQQVIYLTIQAGDKQDQELQPGKLY